MTRHKGIALAILASVAIAVAAGSLYRLPAQDRPVASDQAPSRADSAVLAAVRKNADAFTRAFNAGDARAVAAFWTQNGEYFGPDGETLRGRDTIEKTYADFFKKNPKATVEIDIQSVRLIGRQTALEEGTLKVRLPEDKEPGVSQYSILHVHEDDAWRMASVREWIPDPQELISVKDIEWLLGSWQAKSNEAELRITYGWDEDKVFLRGRYVLKRGDKVVSSGTQILGKNPAGGLRSWLFDSSGTYGESVWTREEGRWVMEASGTLPDGSEVTAVNIMIPLGKDAFTWQSIERTAAGSALPDTPPVKVTRVKGDR
jgi:uncharacterized protein (TIGR02246 family)